MGREIVDYSNLFSRPNKIEEISYQDEAVNALKGVLNTGNVNMKIKEASSHITIWATRNRENIYNPCSSQAIIRVSVS